MTALWGLDLSFRYRSFDSDALVVCGRELDVESVLHGLPVRRPPTYRGQVNYLGLFWSATTIGLLIYESLLELDRLWSSDFYIDVSWIATQPFEITGPLSGKPRRHIPDLMFMMSDGKIRTVDVKPASRVDLPDVAAVFDWTARICSELGWDYEVWSGESVTTMTSIHFLGSTRRRDLVDSAMAALVLDVFRDGQTVDGLLDAVSGVVSDRILAKNGGGDRVDLMAAVDHGTGVILGQVRIGVKANEITCFQDLLDGITNLAGVIVMMDALHAQRSHAGCLIKRGAHFIMTVKGNQRSLQRQLKVLPWKCVPVGNKQSYKSHGSTGSRSIKVVTIDAGILFPHAAQAAQITRRSRRNNGTKWGVETVYIVLSLPATRISAAELNTMVRGHWTIENRFGTSRSLKTPGWSGPATPHG